MTNGIQASFVNNLRGKYVYEHDIELFLIAVMLHKQKRINDDKLKALFKQSKSKERIFKRTYHCKINDEWYSDEPFVDIMQNVLSELPHAGYFVEIEELIKYVNLYLNKNRNYCIDYIHHEIVKPLIEKFERGNSYLQDFVMNALKDFDIDKESTTYVSYENFQPHGYCCSDCDGSYNQYKSQQYEREVTRTFKEDYTKKFQEYFESIKKPQYTKHE